MFKRIVLLHLVHFFLFGRIVIKELIIVPLVLEIRILQMITLFSRPFLQRLKIIQGAFVLLLVVSKLLINAIILL